MRAVFLPSDLDGSGHYRLLFPMRELSRRGVEVMVAPHVIQASPVKVFYGVWRDGRLVLPVTDWLREARFDVLVMQQRAEPFWADEIRRLQGQGKRVLVDTDDCWVGLPAWNPGSRKPRVEVDAMLRQLAAADGLSCATPALADLYGEWQPNTRVIRNRLDWRMWADVTPVYERPSRRVRVGWMGELRWRRGDLEVLRGVLGPWLEANPDVEFVAAGDPRVHDLLGVPQDQRITTNRTNFWDGDLADITATFDIGLVPLDMSDEQSRRLNEGKSHLKGLEYNACGVPFIASPSESYIWYAANGGRGMLASNPRGWRAALDELAGEVRYGTVGRAARKAAERHSLQAEGGLDDWEHWLTGGGAHTDAAYTLLAA